jgi:hypothetical protein
MIEEEAYAGYETVLTYSYYDDDSIQENAIIPEMYNAC